MDLLEKPEHSRELEDLSTGEVIHVPKPEVLKELWESRRIKEKNATGAAKFPADVRLVIGVFSTRTASPVVHEVHRTTWMAQEGVCPLLRRYQPGCSVYVAFVMGDSWLNNTSGPDVSGPDVLFLNSSENMNLGKSRLFFWHVARTYPWVTHIAKMDLDTYPYVHKLTESLHQHLGRMCHAYVGVPMDYYHCGMGPHCPPKPCGMPRDGNFLKYTRRRGCWSFMQGGLYIMTTWLAGATSREGGYWSWHSKGAEDVIVGYAVFTLGRLSGSCVDTWNPEAWDHLGSFCFTGHEYRCGVSQPVS